MSRLERSSPKTAGSSRRQRPRIELGSVVELAAGKMFRALLVLCLMSLLVDPGSPFIRLNGDNRLSGKFAALTVYVVLYDKSFLSKSWKFLH